MFSLLELFFSYCIVVGEREPTWNAGHCFARKFLAYPNVATSEARIWLAICEFLWLLTNRNSGLLLLCTELTLLCIQLSENCVYLESKLSNFFMHIIRNSYEPRSWSWSKLEELNSSPIIKLYGSKKVVTKINFLSLPLSLPLSPPLSPLSSPSLSPLSPPSLSLSSPSLFPSLPLSLPPSLSPPLSSPLSPSLSPPLSLPLSLPPLSPPLSPPSLSPSLFPLSLLLSLKVK